MANRIVYNGRATTKPQRNAWKYVGILAIIALVAIIAVPKVMDMSNISFSIGDKKTNADDGNGNDNINNDNEPGTAKMYPALDGDYYDAEYQQDTLRIVTPEGYETRPSSSEDSQFATADWLQDVREYSKNAAWKRSGDQGKDTLDLFVSALEENDVRYDRKKVGNSYDIKMPEWNGKKLGALHIDSGNIGDIKFDNPDKVTDIYKPAKPSSNTGSSDTGSNSSNTGNKGSSSGTETTLYSDSGSNDGSSGESGGSLYA